MITDAKKIARLRCSLATKAAHTIKNRHIDEYQEIYWDLLREHGLQPTSNTNRYVMLAAENKRLREVLKQKEHEWNYPKPKEQDDDNDW
jgi:hypothetical protein